MHTSWYISAKKHNKALHSDAVNSAAPVSFVHWASQQPSATLFICQEQIGLKEEIGWLKVAFGIAVALDASLVAWLAQNYATASPIIVGAGLIAVLVVASMIVLINRRAYKHIEELENV
jgi:drug/metabolite transporter (DMT)-like permease